SKLVRDAFDMNEPGGTRRLGGIFVQAHRLLIPSVEARTLGRHQLEPVQKIRWMILRPNLQLSLDGRQLVALASLRERQRTIKGVLGQLGLVGSSRVDSKLVHPLFRRQRSRVVAQDEARRQLVYVVRESDDRDG